MYDQGYAKHSQRSLRHGPLPSNGLSAAGIARTKFTSIDTLHQVSNAPSGGIIVDFAVKQLAIIVSDHHLDRYLAVQAIYDRPAYPALGRLCFAKKGPVGGATVQTLP